MTIRREDTVRDIVDADFRTAAVFHRYRIPLCCGGERTLADACGELGLDEAALTADLERVGARRMRDESRAGQWDVATVTAYIVGHHHAQLRLALPAIAAHARQLAVEHGDVQPELRPVARMCEALILEMTSHMAKEETVLFPAIVALADPGRPGMPEMPFVRIADPLAMMEEEHARALETVAEIRRLTASSTPPSRACSAYRVCLAELQAFERDLVDHVALEERVLFPKARALAAAAGC